MSLRISKLTAEDGNEIYEMLQEIPANENGFINSVSGKTYDEYKEWLTKAVSNSKQKGIIDGWKVPQTTYWLFENDKPVGYGKLRHLLTDKLLEDGGNIGYSIRPSERGKGLGKAFVSMLIEESKKLNIANLLFTIKIDNIASKKIAISNGGVIEKETKELLYIELNV